MVQTPSLSSPTAAILIIGNEILCGRTQDTNSYWLAQQLTDMGIVVSEMRVIGDFEDRIIAVVNALRRQATYVFCTGGIGPTHDDITAASIAAAFGVPLIRHLEADSRLRAHYPPEKQTDARMKMADVPDGASLIDNPLTIAPGFRIENVFVMAGVPAIMKEMFTCIRPHLSLGAPIYSETIVTQRGEGDIAVILQAAQTANPTVEIGSYPSHDGGKWFVRVSLRSTDKALLAKVYSELQGRLGS